MAFCLSFIIIASLAPMVGIQVDRQIDFWLLWLGTMLILALPITYLEIALAKRSKTTALNALSSLTRDADASQKWRLVGWLAVIFIPFLAGGILSNASQWLGRFAFPAIESNLLFLGLAIIAVALSFIPRKIILICTVMGVLAAIVLAQLQGTALTAWHVTAVELSEWGSATVLALVASGLGMGLYWQTSLAETQQQDQATKTVLPIWLAQLLAIIAFGFFAVQTPISGFMFVIAVLAGAALLLNLAREQLLERQINLAVQWVVLLLALLIWAIPAINPVFNTLLMLWGLVICLIYAIFAGWMMKISHLRKAMNFSNELFYNVWRIAVRVVLPISIIVAMIAIIGQWF
jgi:SNF family Na+-dependent transporter